ncbi:DUF4189 domain-containing protein [Gordonia sp. NPDC003429]
MSTTLKRTIVAGLMTVAAGAGLAGVSAPAQALAPNHFGAIAISTDTGNTAYAINYYSPEAARVAAERKCGAADCRWVVTMDRSCGAVAQHPVTLNWGYAYGPTRAAAQQAARNEAGFGANDIVWACTDR